MADELVILQALLASIAGGISYSYASWWHQVKKAALEKEPGEAFDWMKFRKTFALTAAIGFVIGILAWWKDWSYADALNWPLTSIIAVGVVDLAENVIKGIRRWWKARSGR